MATQHLTGDASLPSGWREGVDIDTSSDVIRYLGIFLGDVDAVQKKWAKTTVNKLRQGMRILTSTCDFLFIDQRTPHRVALTRNGSEERQQLAKQMYDRSRNSGGYEGSLISDDVVGHGIRTFSGRANREDGLATALRVRGMTCEELDKVIDPIKHDLLNDNVYQPLRSGIADTCVDSRTTLADEGDDRPQTGPKPCTNERATC